MTMNKKGYTLIELLTTITLLGLIATMASINTIKLFDEKKEQEEKNQEEIITSAAYVYIELSENKKFKEECLKNSCTINTNTLIEKGLLDEKNVSKNQVIHIYLDQKVKKCIIK